MEIVLLDGEVGYCSTLVSFTPSPYKERDFFYGKKKEIDMKLFVVQHRHSAEACPAHDPHMASMLLAHLSRQNAHRFGVNIHSEAVIDGGHTLYLIVEAENKESVSKFMEPFTQAGTVEIQPASRCEAVVERGEC